MKCPMQVQTMQGVGTNQWIDFFECIGKECAWWDKVMGKCAILSLVDGLTDLNTRVSGVSKSISVIPIPGSHRGG